LLNRVISKRVVNSFSQMNDITPQPKMTIKDAEKITGHSVRVIHRPTEESAKLSEVELDETLMAVGDAFRFQVGTESRVPFTVELYDRATRETVYAKGIGDVFELLSYGPTLEKAVESFTAQKIKAAQREATAEKIAQLDAVRILTSEVVSK
jgi:hypothetical protein